jgi:dipeptide/tripeptide permease
LRAACVLVAFCESARHHRSGMGSSLIPSSIAFVMFYICFDQMQNNLISQAAQMEASGTPNDLLPAMNQVGCIVLGPLIQGWVYPLLHRRQIYLKPIMRITIGFSEKTPHTARTRFLEFSRIFVLKRSFLTPID